MFCKNCGAQLPENAGHCPNCGTPVAGNDDMFRKFGNAANSAFNRAEDDLRSAVNDVHQTFSGGSAPYGGERLQDNRSIVSYILLSIITCGIYGYYFIYKMAHDINIACAQDGESTAGLVKFIVLSFITCGLYSLYWQYNLGNRLAANAPRYGMSFQENGTTILMWGIVGAFVCGLGPLIAMHILIKNSNKICAAYNHSHGM